MRSHRDDLPVQSGGLVSNPGSPFWVADEGTGVSTLYNGSGNLCSLPIAVFTVPPPAGQTGPSGPTGIVGNTNPNEFLVSGAGTGALFIFASDLGTISAWNSGTTAVLKVDNSMQANANGTTGAEYTGLALANNAGSDFLYAANFKSGNVDVFDSQFQPVPFAAGDFKDPALPAGYAPFNVANVGGNLIVTFAQVNTSTGVENDGAGLGFVDEFSPGGTLIMRFGGSTAGSNPELNAPWGVALAPANFGAASNDLLVGNLGDSHVNAFDPSTGAFVGQLETTSGNPIVLDGGFTGSSTFGLWGLSFGNGGGSGNTNTLYFTSGFNQYKDGVFGSVTST